jgi:hypothetical protein
MGISRFRHLPVSVSDLIVVGAVEYGYFMELWVDGSSPSAVRKNSVAQLVEQ